MMRSMLDRFFGLREHGTSVRTELLGGTTTFVTMAYIIVVNPAILSFAGMPVGPATVATILAAVFGSLLMGLYANRPIGVAPYMGENAFIAFGLTAMGIGWQQCLGAVFVSGAGFTLITLLGIRALAGGVDLAEPEAQLRRRASACSSSILGLYETGIVTSSVAGTPPAALLVPGTGLLRAPDVPLKIGDLRDPARAAGGLRLPRDRRAALSPRAWGTPAGNRRDGRCRATCSASVRRPRRSSRCRSPATTPSVPDRLRARRRRRAAARASCRCCSRCS